MDGNSTSSAVGRSLGSNASILCNTRRARGSTLGNFWEKESRVESLENELAGLKKVKAESDVRVRDLERKIGVLETKEIEERNKRIRFEEETRDKIDEKES